MLTNIDLWGLSSQLLIGVVGGLVVHFANTITDRVSAKNEMTELASQLNSAVSACNKILGVQNASSLGLEGFDSFRDVGKICTKISAASCRLSFLRRLNRKHLVNHVREVEDFCASIEPSINMKVPPRIVTSIKMIHYCASCEMAWKETTNIQNSAVIEDLSSGPCSFDIQVLAKGG